MIEIKDRSKCCGCTACASVCPVKCITMKVDFEGFLYPSVDQSRCIGCNKCDKVCSFSSHESKGVILNAYACYSKSESILQQSSSGGIFYHLAKCVLLLNGVVYGVRMSDDNTTAEFCRVASIEQLPKIMGSKYIAANVNSAFSDVRTDLNNGKYVMFSGTGCQVNGLRMFLGKEYKRLICVDIICHGVPSQYLWEKYIDTFKAKGHAITNVNFRSKNTSWGHFGLEIHSNRRKILLQDHFYNPYFELYLKDIALRESCYNCTAKSMKLSDLTIADYWGVEKFEPESSNLMGTSLVLTRTRKGESILEDCKLDIMCNPTDVEKALSWNTSEFKSKIRPVERNQFYFDLQNFSFWQVYKKYIPLSMKEKICRTRAFIFAKKIKENMEGKRRHKEFNHGV